MLIYQEKNAEFPKSFKDFFSSCSFIKKSDNLDNVHLTRMQKKIAKEWDGESNLFIKQCRRAGATALSTAKICYDAITSKKHYSATIVCCNGAGRFDYLNKITDTLATCDATCVAYKSTFDEISCYVMGRGIVPHTFTIKVFHEFKPGYYDSGLVVIDCAAFRKDELAYIPLCIKNQPNSRYIVFSTPNGYDKFFYSLYKSILSGEVGNFKIINVNWYMCPWFTEGLKWYSQSTDEVLDANPENVSEDVLNELERYWVPDSPWLQKMRSLLSSRMFKNEIENEFTE